MTATIIQHPSARRHEINLDAVFDRIRQLSAERVERVNEESDVIFREPVQITPGIDTLYRVTLYQHPVIRTDDLAEAQVLARNLKRALQSQESAG